MLGTGYEIVSLETESPRNVCQPQDWFIRHEQSRKFAPPKKKKSYGRFRKCSFVFVPGVIGEFVPPVSVSSSGCVCQSDDVPRPCFTFVYNTNDVSKI